MKYIDKNEIADFLPYAELIEALKKGFSEGGNVPLRHHHTVKTKEGTENSLLLMPCWQVDDMIGVKLVMVCPDNNHKNIGSVQSTYILSDATTGITKAIFDGDELTVRRTASASALASSYLSDRDSKTMLMMGTGKLAPHLIRAHASVRSFSHIYIWGRRFDEAKKLATRMQSELDIAATPINDPKNYANVADVISCATLATEPILKGEWLRKEGGQHIDLVGGYTYDMREADNDVMKSSNIFVDTFDGALSEAGDILRPLEEGIISKKDIKGDLFSMVREGFNELRNDNHTVFKSVGTALEDLIAAKFVFNKLR